MCHARRRALIRHTLNSDIHWTQTYIDRIDSDSDSDSDSVYYSRLYTHWTQTHIELRHTLNSDKHLFKLRHTRIFILTRHTHTFHTYTQIIPYMCILSSHNSHFDQLKAPSHSCMHVCINRNNSPKRIRHRKLLSRGPNSFDQSWASNCLDRRSEWRRGPAERSMGGFVGPLRCWGKEFMRLRVYFLGVCVFPVWIRLVMPSWWIHAYVH